MDMDIERLIVDAATLYLLWQGNRIFAQQGPPVPPVDWWGKARSAARYWPIATMAVLAVAVWVQPYLQPSEKLSMRARQGSAIRERLAQYIGESEAMQGVCENGAAPVPDVPQWKAKVEQYLETLGHEYVIRFREGVSEAGLGGNVDEAHRACWADLHVREKNLDRFFDDFRPAGG